MNKLTWKVWNWDCMDHVKYKFEGWIMGVTNVAIWFNDHVLGLISFVGFCVYVYWRSIKTKNEAVKARAEADTAKVELEIKKEQLRGHAALTDDLLKNVKEKDRKEILKSRDKGLFDNGKVK